MEEGDDKTLAIVSFVAAMVGFITMPIIASIVAVITGKIQMNRIRDQPHIYGGKIFAQLGFWIGLIRGIFVILMLMAFIFFYVFVIGLTIFAT